MTGSYRDAPLLLPLADLSNLQLDYFGTVDAYLIRIRM